MRNLVGDDVLDYCPERIVTMDVSRAIDAYAKWQRFGLPLGQGWAAEPAQLIDVLETIDGAQKAADARQMDRGKDAG